MLPWEYGIVWHKKCNNIIFFYFTVPINHIDFLNIDDTIMQWKGIPNYGKVLRTPVSPPTGPHALPFYLR